MQLGAVPDWLLDILNGAGKATDRTDPRRSRGAPAQAPVDGRMASSAELFGVERLLRETVGDRSSSYCKTIDDGEKVQHQYRTNRVLGRTCPYGVKHTSNHFALEIYHGNSGIVKYKCFSSECTRKPPVSLGLAEATAAGDAVAAAAAGTATLAAGAAAAAATPTLPVSAATPNGRRRFCYDSLLKTIKFAELV